MYRPVFILTLALLLAAAGCSAVNTAEPSLPAPVSTQATRVPAPALTTALPIPTPSPTPAPTTLPTATPVPTPTPLSEEALNARIVDARNKLTNLIDSNVADTIITHPDGSQSCEVKMSRELGYLIDATTGESTFVKGDYWSIDADLFRNPMKKDHTYVIIHTHPRMWATCQGSGIVSQYTFSDGDLIATASLTEQGYHIRTLIAITDKEYRIWPKVADDWMTETEIRGAVGRIERRLETSFTYYDPVLQREYYDMDSLMPLLAKELNYSYTVNNHVIA
ncbi:MAG: hypothetical protein M0Q92_07820 [Methanoregula sp.]|jgi:hypothetical protein|nr:hypothetical protein [Methanoregula sp.]